MEVVGGKSLNGVPVREKVLGTRSLLHREARR